VPGSRSTSRPRGPAKPLVVRFPEAREGSFRVRVLQVSPVCRTRGTMGGRDGRVRFRGRLDGRALPPGVYVLSVDDTRVAVAVRRNRAPVRVRTFHNACADLAAVESSQPVGGTALRAAAPAIPAATPPPAATTDPNPHRDVLGVTVGDISESIAELHPAFFVLLGLAVALLAVASVPAAVVPNQSAAAVLAQRRIELTLAGIAALAVVVVAYLLVLT
jgi:hypothetical protein